MRRMTSAQDAGERRLLLHGRRRGRAMRKGQRERFASLLPQLSLALPRAGALDPGGLFPTQISAVWLEIGFGGGEHLAAQAAEHPEVGFIGAEIYSNGVAKLLAEIERRDLKTVRIHAEDARPLVAALAGRSIARAFILFPDPWPKERHKKRRIVSRAFLDELARVMTDGAELRLASDDMDYARQMLGLATEHPAFRWLAEGPDDWRLRPADWPATRYEQKALAVGRMPLYLRFARVAR